MSTIETFYNAETEREWARGERHRTEFAVSLRALQEYLPPPPASVVDIGGGPGRYAIELARRGYAVTLVDLAQANVDFARAKAQEAAVTLVDAFQGNALDLLALPDSGFDAALLMGPLYHLLSESERAQAVREALRVLMPAGVLFAAFITRFAALRDAAQGYPEWLLDNRDYAEQLLATGVHDQPSRGGFTQAYFAHPDEIISFIESLGCATRALIGCEGVVAGHEMRVNALTGPAWEAWVDLNYRLGFEPTLYGAADHLLYIGRKVNRA